ncbi:glycosyltransferase family 4 protein [Candidatus Daviesbacteria bacterium]|nr:glycosyltransferase family 4 protein [Candidatus Daviesbacteria bacterium]
MKIAIYSPYLDTAGGGEKYMLTIAECLSNKNEVDLLLDDHLDLIGENTLRKKILDLHNLDLAKVKFIKAPFGKNSSFFSRLFFLKKYDCLFYNSDGSIFLSTAKKNILHFQLPLEHLNVNGIWGRFKLSSWKQAIFNSDFTREYIQKKFPIKGFTLYPPVSLNGFRVGKKKRKILSVGFFSTSKPKKQELLIKVFKSLVNRNKINELSLHLAGGVMDGNEDFLSQLRKEAIGYKIFFYPNIKLKELIDLYAESLIYWHATGYDESDPKKFEHFGITTVESMASGCIPIVINKGGHLEIIKDKVNGFLWDTPKQLEELTLKVIEDESLQKKISKQAVIDSKKFSKEEFNKKILQLVYD